MKTLLSLLIPLILRAYMTMIKLTCRIRLLSEDPLDGGPINHQGPSGRIYAFWHGHLLMTTWSFRHRGVYAVVSRSRDGEYLARLLTGWGYRPIRGSSSKGWVTVYRQALQVLKKNGTIGIAPDGPRGPLQTVNPGIIRMAMATGAEIVPVGVGYSSRKRLSSWDKFNVPWLFSRIIVLFGRPYRLKPCSDDGEIDLAERDLEWKLNATTANAQGLSKNH